MKKVLYVMVFVMLLMIGFGCSKETKVVNTPSVAQEIDNKTIALNQNIPGTTINRKNCHDDSIGNYKEFSKVIQNYLSLNHKLKNCIIFLYLPWLNYYLLFY